MNLHENIIMFEMNETLENTLQNLGTKPKKIFYNDGTILGMLPMSFENNIKELGITQYIRSWSDRYTESILDDNKIGLGILSLCDKENYTFFDGQNYFNIKV